MDTEVFIPKHDSGLRKKFGLRDESFVVGYVGMFQKSRMQKEIIDGFFQFKKMKENSQLLMVGAGETLGDIERYAFRKLGKNDVIFTGFIENQRLVDAYNVMDLFILLKGGHDSSLRMLYEAQSCGTYILTYRSYPARRLIETTGYGGLIDDSEDTFGVAESIFSSEGFIRGKL
ncbi:MAG: glycosyltransferase, partial [Deltaproteobacteria bacterium]|nr:glycosyltransferase [Deltaproteobacteria bacterium]